MEEEYRERAANTRCPTGRTICRSDAVERMRGESFIVVALAGCRASCGGGLQVRWWYIRVSRPPVGEFVFAATVCALSSFIYPLRFFLSPRARLDRESCVVLLVEVVAEVVPGFGKIIIYRRCARSGLGVIDRYRTQHATIPLFSDRVTPRLHCGSLTVELCDSCCGAVW